MIDRGAAAIRPPSLTGTHQAAAASTHSCCLPASKVRCRSMAMPATMRWPTRRALAVPSRSHFAGRTSAANSTTSQSAATLRSQRRHSTGSANYTASKPTSAAAPPTNAAAREWRAANCSSMLSRRGSASSSRRSQRARHSPKQSATAAEVGCCAAGSAYGFIANKEMLLTPNFLLAPSALSEMN